MTNRRRLERKRPNQPITVYDVTTGDDMGRVANITTEGMMLVSQRDIPVGGIFQLQLVLSDPQNGIGTLDLGAESLWTAEADEQKNYHWTGFQIIDISEESLDFLDSLMQRLGTYG